MRGAVYQIEPSAIVLDRPATLRFDLSGFDNAQNLAVYKFDADFEMWQVQIPVTQRQENSLSVEVDQLGQFSLGEVVWVDAPSFISTVDQLFEMAPDDAVGFKIAVGFAKNDDPVIRLDDQTVVGGCAGVIQNGESEEQTLLRKPVQVFVNDVQTQVEFIFTARWFVTGDGGCVGDQILQASKSL